MSFNKIPLWVENDLSIWEAERYLRSYIKSNSETQKDMRRTRKYALAYSHLLFTFCCPIQRNIFFRGIADKLFEEEHEPLTDEYFWDTQMLINKEGDREEC